MGGKIVIKVPRVACINDISGYGRCSLTIALPVFSVMGVQCCPVPTAVLSCHTGFDKFYFKDMTESLVSYLDDWNSKDIRFDAVYSGFLGSYEQIEITKDFMQNKKSSLCVVDPVMGDNGQMYSTYTDKMCEEMRKLVCVADVITPNITEACNLTSSEYIGEQISLECAKEMMKKLEAMGNKSVVITGIVTKDKLVNLVLENSQVTAVESEKSKSSSGTGDLFASVVTGMLVKGYSLCEATRKASDFIYDVLEFTSQQNIRHDKMEGVLFEPLLYKLCDGFDR